MAKKISFKQMAKKISFKQFQTYAKAIRMPPLIHLGKIERHLYDL